MPALLHQQTLTFCQLVQMNQPAKWEVETAVYLTKLFSFSRKCVHHYLARKLLSPYSKAGKAVQSRDSAVRCRLCLIWLRQHVEMWFHKRNPRAVGVPPSSCCCRLQGCSVAQQKQSRARVSRASPSGCCQCHLVRSTKNTDDKRLFFWCKKKKPFL